MELERRAVKREIVEEGGRKKGKNMSQTKRVQELMKSFIVMCVWWKNKTEKETNN